MHNARSRPRAFPDDDGADSGSDDARHTHSPATPVANSHLAFHTPVRRPSQSTASILQHIGGTGAGAGAHHQTPSHLPQRSSYFPSARHHHHHDDHHSSDEEDTNTGEHDAHYAYITRLKQGAWAANGRDGQGRVLPTPATTRRPTRRNRRTSAFWGCLLITLLVLFPGLRPYPLSNIKWSPWDSFEQTPSADVRDNMKDTSGTSGIPSTSSASPNDTREPKHKRTRELGVLNTLYPVPRDEVDVDVDAAMHTEACSSLPSIHAARCRLRKALQAPFPPDAPHRIAMCTMVGYPFWESRKGSSEARETGHMGLDDDALFVEEWAWYHYLLGTKHIHFFFSPATGAAPPPSNSTASTSPPPPPLHPKLLATIRRLENLGLATLHPLPVPLDSSSSSSRHNVSSRHRSPSSAPAPAPTPHPDLYPHLTHACLSVAPQWVVAVPTIRTYLVPSLGPGAGAFDPLHLLSDAHPSPLSRILDLAEQKGAAAVGLATSAGSCTWTADTRAPSAGYGGSGVEPRAKSTRYGGSGDDDSSSKSAVAGEERRPSVLARCARRPLTGGSTGAGTGRALLDDQYAGSQVVLLDSRRVHGVPSTGDVALPRFDVKNGSEIVDVLMRPARLRSLPLAARVPSNPNPPSRQDTTEPLQALWYPARWSGECAHLAEKDTGAQAHISGELCVESPTPPSNGVAESMATRVSVMGVDQQYGFGEEYVLAAVGMSMMHS